MNNRLFLLADDDGDDTEMFVEALVCIDNNVVCHTAWDGREALNKLDALKQKPDLIFLDVNMPVMTGWQCLKILKEDARYKEIPVIVISTSSYMRDMDIAVDSGAVCYLTKPNDFNELKGLLQGIVKNVGADLAAALRVLQANGSPFVYVSA